MEAIVAERGQITLPKAVRDALGLTKGTKLKVELDGGRIVLSKDVNDALSRVRGRFKLLSAEDKGGGRWLLKHELTVEIDGGDKPALIAEWLTMQVVKT